MADEYLTVAEATIDEGDSKVLKFDILDENGDYLDVDAITAFAMTLYDKVRRTVINGRENQDLLTADGVSIEAVTGSRTHMVYVRFDEDDNSLQTTGRAVDDTEEHWADFRVVFDTDDGPQTKGYRAKLYIRKRGWRVTT